VVNAVQSLSFMTHFQNISKGVIYVPDAIFFAAVILSWLAANILIVDLKKAD
jgi:ABC-2 type transport system permease protein